MHAQPQALVAAPAIIPMAQQHDLLAGTIAGDGNPGVGDGAAGPVNVEGHCAPLEAAQQPSDSAHSQGAVYPALHDGAVVAPPQTLGAQLPYSGAHGSGPNHGGESPGPVVGGVASNPISKGNASGGAGMHHSNVIQASAMRGIDASQLRVEAVGMPMMNSNPGLIGGDGGSRRGHKRPWPTPHCEQPDCFKSPSYGANGTPPLRCASHKAEGDVYVKNQCVQLGCSKVCNSLASFLLPTFRLSRIH